MLVLFALFFRPLGFEYRSKVADPRWRSAWDWGLFVGGFVPALVFGVAFGNLLQGVPLQYDEFVRPTYTGSFWGLLNPFALLAGIIIAPVMAFGGGILALLLSGINRPGLAFIFSGAALAGVILTAGFAMYPFVIPSSTDPNSSLTIYDATSSHRTLNLMFMAVVILLPVVIGYTSWVYSVLRGKITEEKIRQETHSVY
jgi:cytochrome d ubiquinol oxidase subunit II